MKQKYYAVKNHKIVSEISVLPFSVSSMNRYVEEQEWDDWIELTPQAAKLLMGLR